MPKDTCPQSTTIPFCETAQAVQREVNCAIRNQWTLDRFVNHHISPASHNFSTQFTEVHIVDGGRVFHDPCHPFLALAYKKLGVDTSQYRYWYNGNHQAESLVVPLEVFFNDMCRERQFFSRDYYQHEVRRYYRNNAFKDKGAIERAIRIADSYDHPTSLFHVCRQAHFEDGYLINHAQNAFRKGIMQPQSSSTETKWGENIGKLELWSDDFLDQVYDAVLPALELARENITKLLESYNSVFDKETVSFALREQRMDHLWDAINKHPTYSPTPSP
jgi:hypothetical protein